MDNRRNCSVRAISPFFLNILLPDIRFSFLNREKVFLLFFFSFRGKQLLTITRVACILIHSTLFIYFIFFLFLIFCYIC